MQTTLNRGIRRTGPSTNIAAAGVANAAAVYQQSNFAQQQGTKSILPVKATLRNNAGGNTWVNIGTGVGGAFAALTPPIFLLNGVSDTFELTAQEAFADVTAYPDTLVAGGSIDVQLEVEERG